MTDGSGDGQERTPPSLAVRALRALNARDALNAGNDRSDPAQPDDATVGDAPVDEATTVDLRKDAAPDAEADADAEYDPEHDPEPEPDLEPVTPPPAATAGRPWGLVGTAALLVAAIAFAVVALVVWKRADDDSTVSRAAARDAVLRGARIGITTVNTSDYHDPGKVLDSWTAVSTGGLAKQYKDNRADAIKVLSQAKVVTTATVLAAAVTVLDLKKGTATVIASVDVVRTPVTGAKARTRNRFEATLQRVGSSWLLSGVKIVAVQLS